MLPMLDFEVWVKAENMKMEEIDQVQLEKCI